MQYFSSTAEFWYFIIEYWGFLFGIFLGILGRLVAQIPPHIKSSSLSSLFVYDKQVYVQVCNM